MERAQELITEVITYVEKVRTNLRATRVTLGYTDAKVLIVMRR